ncbi:MAG TPA: hypothetical protein DIT35_01730, partial [Rhodospirillaceae bacterium]|nr:hypothetical protein [Rhodospirillaceae bacterium]
SYWGSVRKNGPAVREILDCREAVAVARFILSAQYTRSQKLHELKLEFLLYLSKRMMARPWFRFDPFIRGEVLSSGRFLMAVKSTIPFDFGLICFWRN